jgi:hypothetical protein
MMGTQAAPERLFYDFCLEDHVPDDHLLRRIGRFLDLGDVRQTLQSPRIYRCSTGRGEMMALGHGPTSPSMLSTMLMCVPKVGYSERPAGFMRQDAALSVTKGRLRSVPAQTEVLSEYAPSQNSPRHQ